MIPAGQRFGRLTVVGPVPSQGRGHQRYLCSCLCGNSKEILGTNLIQGRSTSCGCRRREIARKSHTTHGLSKSPESEAWRRMLCRVRNPNDRSYPTIGGAGIKVHEPWLKFEQFYEDLGPRPDPSFCLGRHDLNYDYCPDNVAWMPRNEYLARIQKERWNRR